MEFRKQDALFENHQLISLTESSVPPLQVVGVSEHPAPHLCTIYIRDIFQFLPREKVDQLQQVGRAMDIAVVGASHCQLEMEIGNVEWLVAQIPGLVASGKCLAKRLLLNADINDFANGVDQVVMCELPA